MNSAPAPMITAQADATSTGPSHTDWRETLAHSSGVKIVLGSTRVTAGMTQLYQNWRDREGPKGEGPKRDQPKRERQVMTRCVTTIT